MKAVLSFMTLTLTLNIIVPLVTSQESPCSKTFPSCLCTIDKHHTSVNCTGANVTSVPSDLPSNTTDISIDNATIEVLPPIHEYRSLLTLRISHSRVRYIKSKTFAKLPQLTHLVLESNQLTSLWKDTFSGLKSLTVLSLENNPLHIIKNGTFHGSVTPSLNYLQLSHCDLLDIEADAFTKMNSLTELYIDQNRLRRIPYFGKIIGDVPVLRFLNISNNHISQIISDPFPQLAHLETLDLSNNFISFMAQQTFSGLIGLKKLYLRNNTLEVIEEHTFLGNHKILNDLDLSFNKLKTLRKSVIPNSVTKLHLHHNQFNCDCNISWMLNSTAVINTNSEMPEFKCNSPKHMAGLEILSLQKDDLCGKLNQPASHVTVIVGVVAAIIISGVFLYLICVIYRKRKRRYKQPLEANVPYSQVNRDTEMFSV